MSPSERDWIGLVDMPEYHNMKRLDPYVRPAFRTTSRLIFTPRFTNRLQDWCQTRLRTLLGYDLLRELFAYDPENRLTAKEALQHKWFYEEPRPTHK